MFKTILKNFLWVTPVGLMMVSGGQATAATILLDDFDSLQGTSNKECKIYWDWDHKDLKYLQPSYGGNFSLSFKNSFQGSFFSRIM